MTTSSNPALRAQPALVEIVERKRHYDPDSLDGGEHLVRPNEVRINGVPLLVPAGESITVHDIGLKNDDCVQVTLTLWARRVVLDSERADCGLLAGDWPSAPACVLPPDHDGAHRDADTHESATTEWWQYRRTAGGES